ncbi:MAG: hypothetical protein IPL49_13675 [Saprospirales bacterium]|nr:hypothetical protein [Saprospirales bacterium]
MITQMIFFSNFVDIARQGVTYSASLMNEEFGEDLKIEVLDQPSQFIVLFSHKKEPRFPL